MQDQGEHLLQVAAPPPLSEADSELRIWWRTCGTYLLFFIGLGIVTILLALLCIWAFGPVLREVLPMLRELAASLRA